jgi:hypothetical protein
MSHHRAVTDKFSLAAVSTVQAASSATIDSIVPVPFRTLLRLGRYYYHADRPNEKYDFDRKPQVFVQRFSAIQQVTHRRDKS